MKKSWRAVATSAFTITALFLTACGTGGVTKEETSTDITVSGEQRDLSYSVVIHGDPDGSFWNVVKKGAEDAGEQYGVKVSVTGDQEGSKQSTLIQSALANEPDGLVVSLANPDALSGALGESVSQSVPFVTINSGADRSRELGAIAHVGQTETVAGQGAGEELKEAGVTNLICVIHEAGNIGLEQRCSGAAEAFGGSVANVQVDLNNPQDIQSTIKSRLLGDTSIDGVLALEPSVASAVLAGVKGAESDAVVASFDLDEKVLKSIQDGDILFTVDQQQYLQGYLPIVMLVLYDDNLNTIGGGQPVLTGPAFITKDNVDTVADLINKGTR